MATQQKLDLNGEYFNKGLFADNYLDNRLPDHPVWQSLDEDLLKEILSALTILHARHAEKFTDRTSEAVTEEDFIKPVLEILWNEGEERTWQVQPVISIPGMSKTPDYAMFASAADRNAADKLAGTLAYWSSAIALGDAKRWQQPLDKKRGDETPSAQITNYLYRSKVRWGILTNGAKWRLYEKDKSSAGEIYFEVDLDEIIRENDSEGFKWFYLFFRREAFLRDKDGISFLDQVLKESQAYTTAVGKSLKESVYDALSILMTGFLREPRNELDGNDIEQLALIHKNALIVLYRLLFLLYAEDRNLLPISDDIYGSYSLRGMHAEVNRQLRSRKPRYSPKGRTIWPKLLFLFEILDKGLEDAKVPAYNGGLFSPDEYPHIAYRLASLTAQWQIGDAYIAEAIDRLAYERKEWDKPGMSDIDYATLEVRDLGSIYEGLLELRPHIATEEMVEVCEGKKHKFKEVSKLKSSNKKPKGQTPRRVRPGEVYLVTERGERKATGSYYTPGYIVKYIVEQTLDPLASEAAQETAKLKAQVETELQRLHKLLGEKGSNPAERESLESEIHLVQRQLLEPYRNLKILDPAMGSGHFLVAAADFLSLAMATDPSLDPIDIGDENPQAYYRRFIVENCLYGVDLNPLAVELAKLSLWLHTVSRDKALSFLDHHLRTGNSLIGARIEADLSRVPPSADSKERKKQANEASNQQMALGFTDALTGTHLHYFLDTFRKIMEAPSDTADDERYKDTQYRKMDGTRDTFREVANVWLASYFGVPISEVEYQQAVNALKSGEDERVELRSEEWFDAAQEIAREKRFFHWELEFPEAFFEMRDGCADFKPKGERGFDAVIGNPPYVRQEGLGLDKPVFEHLWNDVYHGSADLYVYFYGLGLNMLSRKGTFGMITKNKFMRADYGGPLRKYLTAHADIQEITDFGELPVFEDSAAFPCIVILRQGTLQSTRFTQVKALDFKSLQERVDETSEQLSPQAFEGMNWSLRSDAEVKLLRKLESQGIPLKQYLAHRSTRTYYGIKTGFNRAFIIDSATRDQLIAEDTKSDEIIKPLVIGDDIRCYEINFHKRYLIWTYIGVPIKNYPAIFNHLKQHKQQLEKRWDKGDHWWELRACDYYEEIEKPKILYPDIASEARFAFDDQSLFCANTAYFIPLDDYYLLSLLNSKCCFGYMKRTAAVLGDEDKRGRLRLIAQYMENLPVPDPQSVLPAEKSKQLIGLLRKSYALYLKLGDFSPIIKLVQHSTPHSPVNMDAARKTLAYLAKQMTQMHKKKQKLVSNFLGWLSGSLLDGVELDELAGKTQLRAYFICDAEELTRVLRKGKNQKVLSSHGVNPNTTAFFSMLKEEHEKNLSKVNPLFKRITATDHLIDQIVYKLYGLTDDEIAIVEGSVAKTRRQT